MTSMTKQYSAMASQASEAAEKAADTWAQGVRKLADRFPALPQVDLVPAVERYFDLVQRAVDLNRGMSIRWAQAAGTLSGMVREQAQAAGHVAQHRAESVSDVVRERAESMEKTAARQADQAEQVQAELARESSRLEREQARQAHQRARERYEGLTKAELSKQLAARDLPRTGTVNELIERLVEADTAR
jgi:hypothetical protein